MSVKYETLAQDFKKVGKFDAIRKQILQEFTDSPSGQKLTERLRFAAGEAKTLSQPQLISILSQPSHYIEAERDLNVNFLGTVQFKERLKQELKQIWEQKYSKPLPDRSDPSGEEWASTDPQSQKRSSDIDDKSPKRQRVNE
jgi:hypothetical protein